ncbi:Macrocin O-methyltransferase [Balamuthia mandrillaris]
MGGEEDPRERSLQIQRLVRILVYLGLAAFWTVGVYKVINMYVPSEGSIQDHISTWRGGYQVRESRMRDKYLNVIRDSLTGAALLTIDRDALRCWEQNLPESACPPADPRKRQIGQDWPVSGLTMIGTARMNNIRNLLERVEKENIPGDFMECGVWRGGASIYAQAVLSSGNIDRHVWLADSFQGLPRPRTSNDVEMWSQMDYLKVAMEDVVENFKAFDLFDPERVHFCKEVADKTQHQIAVLRMDGDMYESTMDQLFNLYPFVRLPLSNAMLLLALNALSICEVVDDWQIPACQRAVKDFWEWHGLTQAVTPVAIDDWSLYWKKTSEVPLQWHRYQALLKDSPQTERKEEAQPKYSERALRKEERKRELEGRKIERQTERLTKKDQSKTDANRRHGVDVYKDEAVGQRTVQTLSSWSPGIQEMVEY